MCDPVTIGLSLASTAAGNYMQQKAQRDARSKINRMTAEADMKNKNLIADAQAAQQGEAGKFEQQNFKQESDDKTAALAQRFIENLSNGILPGESVTSSNGTPRIVAEYEARQRGKAKDEATQQAEALAALRGFSETMFDRNVGIGRSAEKTGMNSGFIQGNSEALSSDVAQVNPSSPFGDLLTGLGMAGLTSGLDTPVPGVDDIVWNQPALNSSVVAKAASKTKPASVAAWMS